MNDRRKSDRLQVSCIPQNPVCMTFGFMFGIIVGSLIHTEQSILSILTSVVLATVVFHYTFVRTINFSKLIRFFKKGS